MSSREDRLGEIISRYERAEKQLQKLIDSFKAQKEELVRGFTSQEGEKPLPLEDLKTFTDMVRQIIDNTSGRLNRILDSVKSTKKDIESLKEGKLEVAELHKYLWGLAMTTMNRVADLYYYLHARERPRALNVAVRIALGQILEHKFGLRTCIEDCLSPALVSLLTYASDMVGDPLRKMVYEHTAFIAGNLWTILERDMTAPISPPAPVVTR